jgi:signal transduction histidine kinase
MSWDLSIGQRLAIGFGLLVLTFVVFASAIGVWNRESAKAQEAFIEESDPLSRGGEAVERSLLYVGIGARSYLMRPEPERLQRYLQYQDSVTRSLEELGQARKDEESEGLYRRMTDLIEPYLKATTAAVESRSRGAYADDEGELTELRERALESAQRFTDLQRRKTTAAIAGMTAAREKVMGSSVAAAVLATFLCLGIAYFTSQSIQRPTRKLMEAAAAVDAGNWRPAMNLAPPESPDQPALAETNNEMSRLSRAIGKLAISLERRERRLHAKREVAHATASTLEKEPLAVKTLQAVVEYVNAEVGAVLAFDAPSGTLVPLATHALAAPLSPLRIGEGIPGEAAKERHTVIVRNVPRDSGFEVKLGYDQAPPRSVAAAPILFGETLHGVLLVASLRSFDDDAVSFIESAATQLGVGLQNVFDYEEVQRLLTDVRDRNLQIQAQNEELQAQNEEIQAQAEHIQSQSEELQAQNEELRQQGEELRAQAAIMAEADERKNQFLGVLAHELRNPMAPITNSLVILRRTPPGSEHALRAQTVIERQARHLNRLIDDLLDITRISQGKIRVQRDSVDFIELVRTCVEDHRTALESQSIQFEMKLPREPVQVTGDQTRLSQVMGNLLSNAIKFTDRGGHIAVELDIDRSERVACLRVQDSGVGMDAALLSRLFQPFSQGMNDLARSSGLGLGLALVKALVTLHGGTVEARSDGPGKGSEFIVKLPLARAA